MGVIELLKRIKRRWTAWRTRRRAAREAKQAFAYDRRRFLAHAGALHLDRRAAAVAEIVMGYHVLEKGLTMPRRRLGFGQERARNLARLVTTFETAHGTDSQVTHAIAVLRAYRDLHRDWPEPMPWLDDFLAARPATPAAVEPQVTKADFYRDCAAAFPAFAASRHVVRHFAGPVPRETIERAVTVALTAPSACNRQHARVHVIDDPALRDALFALQGGTRGFGTDADKVIVVTVDLASVRWGWERHDGYVNGGIFVMNLCYALHYFKVAHCILHWSVSPAADRAARRLLNLPPGEEIVQMLVCGDAPVTFAVAASPRRPLTEMMTWHGRAS